MPSISLWNQALILAVFTVFYNLIEGVISVFFGASDQTLSLFGFGLDSFVEVVSGIGVWHMVVRIKTNADSRDSFERLALRITGISFYVLTAGLVLTALYNAYHGTKPTTTIAGIIISIISIVAMTLLMFAKLKVGKQLNSKAVIADAHCTKTCLYLSIVLLLSSVFFQVFKIGYFDSLGALAIAYYSYREGKESLEKANGNGCCCEND